MVHHLLALVASLAGRRSAPAPQQPLQQTAKFSQTADIEAFVLSKWDWRKKR